MIEALLFAAGVATVGAAASTAGWVAGKRRGASAAESAVGRRLAAVVTQRDAAERRARDAQGDSARWKALSLAGQPLAGAPAYEDRPSPRDAEELARLVRGLTFIDDVVLSDRTGLPLTREEDRASADLAALAPHIVSSSRRMALSALAVAQLSFETFGAAHVCARPLVGRADGVVLLVRTTSQRANPLAIDAVVHAAASTASDLGLVATPSLASFGSTERFAVADPRFTRAFGLLERELGRDFRAIALAEDGVPVFSAANDGPSAATRRAVSIELDSLQDRVTRTLRAPGMARVEVTLRGGEAITWSALGPRSRLSVVAFGHVEARSGARLDRLLGAVKRCLGGERAVETSTRGAP